MNRRLALVAVSCLLLLVGCDEPTSSPTQTPVPSTTVSASAASTSLPAVDLLSEDESSAFLTEHFMVHVAPMVAPVSDVVLTIGTRDGSLLLVRVTAAGAVRTARLLDESGQVFVPGSAFDEGALFSIAPDGSSLAVRSCAATTCTLHAFDLQ